MSHTTVTLQRNTQPIRLARPVKTVTLARIAGGPKGDPGTDTSLLVAKGDVLTHDGVDAVRLGVGTDGQILKALSTEPTGLQWDTINADDLAVAAPGASVDAGDLSVEGVATTFVRSDHQHAVSTGIPVDIGLANAEGVSTDLARADHVHDMPLSALPLHAASHLPLGTDPLATAAGITIVADAAPAVGVADSFARSDHAHGFPTVAPAALVAGALATEGVAADFVRSDHGHAAPTAVPGATINAGDAAVEGVAGTFVRSDHQHAVATGSAGTIEPDDVAAEGVSTDLARADHTHAIVAATAVEITDASNAEGVATSFARSDHTHSHGARGGGTLHAAATAILAGFMSASDKAALDAHLIDFGNPHQVGITQAYVQDGGTLTLNATDAALVVDGAALPAGEESYLLTTRGATVVLDTRFDTVASRTIIQSGGVGGVDLESSLFPDRATVRVLLDQLEFLPQDRVRTSVLPGAGAFLLQSTIGLNFVNATLSAFVRFAPIIQYHQSANPFGQGLLFNASGIFENLPSVAVNMTTGLTFVAQNRYRANAQTITMVQALESLNQPILDVTAGGTFTMTGTQRLFTARGSILTGATLSGDRICYTADRFSTFTGTLTGTNVGLDITDLQPGVAGAVGIRSAIVAAAGVDFINSVGATGAVRLGGELEIDGALNHDGTTVGLYAVAPVTQDTDIGALTLTTHSGVPNTTLVDVSGTGDDATINDNLHELGLQINALRDHVRRLGSMA